MNDVKGSTQSIRLWGEEAAYWWALLHGDGVTVADQRAFLTWVSRSPERIEAYLEIERLMTVLRTGNVHWPNTPVDILIREAKASAEPIALAPVAAGLGSAIPAEGSTAHIVRRRRVRRLGFTAAAAAVAAVAAVLLVFWLWLPSGVQVYRTSVGEQRSLLLADGSRVTLNSASAIEVQMRKRRRIIHLLRGEALFQVRHNPARPFDVYADGGVVRAIGTEFNVTLAHNYATVTVLEGRVAVMSAAQARLPVNSTPLSSMNGAPPKVHPRLESFPAPAGALIIGVAQRVRITPQGLSRLHAVRNLSATTAWTHRQLVFEHRPLGEVADELNREGDVRIEIDNAALRQRAVTGVIELDDPSSLLEFLSDVPGVQIHREPDGTRVVILQRGRRTGVKATQSSVSGIHLGAHTEH